MYAVSRAVRYRVIMGKIYLISVLVVFLLIAVKKVYCDNRLLNILNKPLPIIPHSSPLLHRSSKLDYRQFPSIMPHPSPLLYPSFQLDHPQLPSCGVLPNLNLDFLPTYPQVLPPWNFNQFPRCLHQPCKYCTPCQSPNCAGGNGAFGCFLNFLKINQILNVLHQINCNTRRIVNELSIHHKPSK